MIQLKPGLQPNTLAKNRKSLSRRPKSGRKKKRGLRFERVFSDAKVGPFEQLEWERRTAEITDDSGKVIFKQENIEVPKSWSALATKIAVSKYFYGDIANGTDPHKGGRETSVRQLIHRVTRTITDCGLADGYFADAKTAEIFYDELTWLCANQYGAFNSPVWFNVGLYHEYGIGKDAGAGNYFYNRETKQAERAATQYEYPQGSACFIQSVDDTMEDIMRLAMSEAMLFKYGSGTGTDLSSLRSTREKLSGGGKPSGPLSFLKVYDQVANVVKSGGKTRRAAKMNTLKDWHPDIEEFIDAKQKEEKKAWALIEQGYDGSYNGDAYGSVMYQNENLSVRVSDEFMDAAVEDREWWTRTVRDGKPCERKEARGLLRKIAEGTYICGDPGMQFDSTIHKWHTCKGTDRQNSTNPCSEYLFLDNTACNLASLNLMKFKGEDGVFDVERFKAAARIYITAQEILVDNASYPIKEIAENSHIFRTLGLGYANLGSLIMSYGYGYDSVEGRAICGAITSIMTGEAYEQSAEIARVMGPFPGYRDARCSGVAKPVAKNNVAPMQEVIELHRSAVSEIAANEEFAYLKKEAAKVWDSAAELGRRHGYRNAQVTVLAPTGTISFLMDCDTTGIEPDIALVKYKLLAGGGMLKIVNQTVTPALEKLGYNSEEIERIIAHIDAFDTIEDITDSDGSNITSGLKPEHLSIFDCAFQALQRRALVRLHGASADDGGGATVPERRDFEDGQHAGNGDGRRNHEHLRRRLAAWLESDRHLSRWLEAFRALEHAQDQRHGRLWRRRRIDRPRTIGEPRRGIGRGDRRPPQTAQSTNPPSHARHAHVVDAPVRDRGTRRLHHRRLVRRRPAGRALHHDVEGRQHHRRVNGHRRHAHLDRAAIRRAARKPGEKIRLSTLRAERLHQESRYPQRDQHHRLRVPLARLPVHQRLQGSDFAQPRASRAAAERNRRDGKKGGQPSGRRSFAHGEKELIDVITNHAPNEGKPVRPDQRPHPRRARAGSARQHVHGHHLLALREQQSDPRRRLRRLHGVRHEPGMQLRPHSLFSRADLTYPR